MTTMTLSKNRCGCALLLLFLKLVTFGVAFAPLPCISRTRFAQDSTAGDKQINRQRQTHELFSMPQSSSSSSPSASGPTSAFRAKRKKSKMKKGKNFVRGRGPASPLPLDELVEHVSKEYITGPGSRLHDVERKRLRFDQSYSVQMKSLSNASVGATKTQQVECSNLLTQNAFEENSAKIRSLDRHPALVLNADYLPLSYLPLSLWHWQESVKAVFNGKVTVVDVYPDVLIRAANLQVPLPSVIALTEYVSPKKLSHRPAFTKRNVFLRDEYRCQYCNNFFHTRDLSLDHVIPRSKGGSLNWENAVTCCTTCNGRKGSLGLGEFRSKWGLALRSEPRCPTQFELAATASRMLPRDVHPTWAPFLPYNHLTTSKNKELTKTGVSKELRTLQSETE